MYRRFHLERLRLVRRLGRRGMLLLLLGIAWILVGSTGIAIPSDRFSSPGIGADTILQMLDSAPVYFLWIVSGSIAVFVGSLHDRRIINKYEALGWNAVLTPPLVWMVFYIWSFFIWMVTHGEEGRAQGLYGLVVWAVVSLIIMIVAGWPEEKFETSLYGVRTSESPEDEEDRPEE